MGLRTLFIAFLALFLSKANGQLTPQQAAAGMMRGINIGNTMEAPDGETTWGNIAVQQRAFTDYKNAGFTAIRIPITWNKRTSYTSPYAVTQAWMDRVEQVVDWGLKQKLIIIINAHHEDWIKPAYTAANKARFDSIWSQIAIRFKNKSDSLIFEIINEPQPLSQANVNDLNKRILQIIRKTNPTRIVSFSGHNWSGANDLIGAAIPNDTDKYLMGYYHSYDPYPFGLVGTGTYGTDADLNATKKQFDDIANWVATKNMPAFLGEFGSIKKCEYNSRMTCYGAMVYEALAHNIPPFAWDDNGDFPIYNRLTGGFNEIKDILIYTQLESPYKFNYSVTGKKNIKLTWVNRSLTDSIEVQRSANSATNFKTIAKIAPTNLQYIDSTVIGGNIYYYRLKTTVPGKIVMSYPIKTAIVCDPIAVVPYFKIGSGALQQGTSVNLKVGDTIMFSPQAASAGTWSWTGPNSFASSSREITVSKIQKTGAGNYSVSLTAITGCPNSATFSVTVCETVPIVPYLQVSGKAQIQDSVAIVTPGGGVKFSPQPSVGGAWSWSGPNGYTSTNSSVIITNIQEAKTGNYVLTYSVTPACKSKCTFVIKFAGTTGNITLNKNQIAIYPNPAKDLLNISGCNGAVLQICDRAGRVVLSKNIGMESELPIHLLPGIYTVKITQNQSVFTKKFVVE